MSFHPGRWGSNHPFTLALLLAMLGCAWATGTVLTRLPQQGLAQLGCAPADLLSWRVWCAFTSVPFTWGGLSFLGLLPLVAISVGLCERAFGTRRAAVIFLAIDFSARLVEAVTLKAISLVLGSAFATSLAVGSRSFAAGPVLPSSRPRC